MSYKAEILKAFGRLGSNGTKNPDERSNVGRYLGEIFLWDYAAELCSSKAREAWRLLAADQIISSDDELRATIEAETVIAKSPHFAMSVKVGNPRMMFDQERFIDAISSKFKIDKHKLVELAKECKSPSRAPLSKKVIEIDA